ncbi:bifunctional tetrahydrofolate synthase/dihydrofolate synthase [Buchnera aphidicola]|uniref:bifunctional tetrahydrofolate synthase/dihydrofolate synthase n=1 Tax=Buchnera aphidicola TaxID=9 RepID=UPI003463868C
MNARNIIRSRSLDDWLLYIENIYTKNIHFSLHRIKLVAKKLNILNFKSFVFTVSGTNGKGSTCAILERFFLNAGYQVGLYTSPHLIHYYERIRINGKYLKDDLLHIKVFQTVDTVRQGIPLTYFEFITLSALLIFQEYSLDIIILEVGLGGRLDATNIIDPNISIITNIALDHTNILGDSREKIGFEKSGIFRKDIYAILGDRNLPNSIYQKSHSLNTCLHRIYYEWDWHKIGDVWNFYDHRGGLYNLPIPKVSLPSAAIALSALRTSNFTFEKRIFSKSLKEVYLPGRFQIILNHPRIIVDVAHNPHAAYFLRKQLEELLLHESKNVNLYAVIGMVFEKDIKSTLFPFFDIINYWYFSTIKTNRSSTFSVLRDILPKNSVACSSISSALNILINQVRKIDIILVFGSFFTVSEAVLFIKQKYHFKGI